MLAVVATRLPGGLLFEIDALDPLTFLGVPLVLGAAALPAAYLPARRASRVHPVTALRTDLTAGRSATDSEPCSIAPSGRDRPRGRLRHWLSGPGGREAKFPWAPSVVAVFRRPRSRSLSGRRCSAQRSTATMLRRSAPSNNSPTVAPSTRRTARPSPRARGRAGRPLRRSWPGAEVPREGQPRGRRRAGARRAPARTRGGGWSDAGRRDARYRVGAGTDQPASASILLETGVLDLTVFVPASVFWSARLLASWVPARRAARVEPLTALRVDSLSPIDIR